MTEHQIVSVDTVGLEPGHARDVQNGHFVHLTISTVIAYFVFEAFKEIFDEIFDRAF